MLQPIFEKCINEGMELVLKQFSGMNLHFIMAKFKYPILIKIEKRSMKLYKFIITINNNI
jgi:hypothetical protein